MMPISAACQRFVGCKYEEKGDTVRLSTDYQPEDDAPWDRLPPELHVPDKEFAPLWDAMWDPRCEACYWPDRKGARFVYCDDHRCEGLTTAGTRCKSANGFAHYRHWGDYYEFCARHAEQVRESA